MANTKVTSRVLADDAVLTANIADDQVTTAKIADDQITSALVADDIALGGNPTTTTQSAGNNTTRIATTAFVSTAVSNLVDSSPSALNTLNELAAALGDDANFSTTVTNSIATKAPLASPTFTGALTIDDITIDGSTISDGATMTLDAGSQIVLDADGGLIQLKDGGTEFAQLKNSSSDLQIISIVDDKDIIFRGSDNGTYFNALTLDMSDSGTALFNHKVDIATIGQLANVANDLTIYSSASGHNGLRFHANGILPTDNAGAIVDNDADLGDPSYRFKDLYLGGKIYSNANGTGGTKATLADFTSSGSIRSILLKGAENTSNQVFLDVVKDINGTETTLFSIADTNVGIGTASPAFTNGSGLEIERDGIATLRLTDTGSSGKVFEIYVDDATGNVIGGLSSGLPMIFKVINAERMRIATNGGLCVGSSSGASSGGVSAYVADNDSAFYANGSNGRVNIKIHTEATGGKIWYFRTGGTAHFGSGGGDLIVLNEEGSAITTWDYSASTFNGDLNDTSDVALKENITDITDATKKIKALKPRNFDWKESNKGNGVDGFIAQEVETVLPNNVVGDDYDPDNPEHGSKAINTSGILAVAVKAIQEQQEQIETLKKEVEELKGG